MAWLARIGGRFAGVACSAPFSFSRELSGMFRGDRWRFVDRRGDARSRNTARRDARAAYPAAPAIRLGANYFGRRKLRGIVCPRNLHVLISILRRTVSARSLNLFASSMNLLGKGSFTVACPVHSFFGGRRIERRGIHVRKRVGCEAAALVGSIVGKSTKPSTFSLLPFMSVASSSLRQTVDR